MSFKGTMASPGQTEAQPIPPGELMRVRCVIISIIVIVVLAGLPVLLVWLVVRPQQLVYTLEGGNVHWFNQRNNSLNATSEILFQAYNPNSKVSIYHDLVKVEVYYGYTNVAIGYAERFYLRGRNTTKFKMNLVIIRPSLSEEVLQRNKSAGFEVYVGARVRFKVGIWKSLHCTLTFTCKPAEVHLDHATTFQRSNCHMFLDDS